MDCNKFSEYENGYVKDITLTGDIYIEAMLSERGRIALRRDSVFYVSPWTGPDIRLRVYGETKGSSIRIVTTCPATLKITRV